MSRTASRPSPTFHLLEPRPYPPLLSLVIPMFNEEGGVDSLRAEVGKFIGEVKGAVEVVLVNDGSSDRTLPKIVEWAKQDRRIKVVHLSRNFGQQLAATAGLDYAAGDAVALLDADLQDPLAIVHRMIERYREGFHVVYGQRKRRRGESLLKRFTAWAFYRLMRGLVYKQIPVDTGDFRLISRQCLSGLRAMHETHRFLRGMVAWVGFPQCAVEYERAPRISGRTKYSLGRMLIFAWTAATSFSILPLEVSLVLGMLVGLLGIEEAIRALLAFSLGWYVVPGWTSLVILTSVIGSALLVSIGILGQYVGKIYEQSKDRPLYLVSQTFNIAGSADNGEVMDFLSENMRADWNARARENARHYVHSGQNEWDDPEFFRTGEINIANEIMPDMVRICGGSRSPRDLQMLEIGCGVGRMTRFLSRIFGRVTALDVSDEMLAQARANLAGLDNVTLVLGDGKTLAGLAAEEFDFVFSFIVLQHVPSLEVIQSYCREVFRVLKPGALFKFQVQGYSDPERESYDTWQGAPVSPEQARQFAADSGFALEYENGAGTHYYWLCFRKPWE